jgi:hypothetical protein
MKLISVEDQIIKAVINALFMNGFVLSVYDGGEITVKRSMDPDEIFAAMKTTDEDYLLANKVGDMNRPHHWVRFIYGNDDVDVINDYTTNLFYTLEPVFKMIEEYEESLK